MKNKNYEKITTAIAALLVAVVGISFNNFAANTATEFYFQGINVSDYYQESGWVILDFETCPDIGNQICTVSHPNISSPADLADALANASGSTIHAKIYNIGASVVIHRPTVGPY
ncbi:hypothetical protein MKQ70_32020 [Chitinophaga sedimenti]|uniref:hypothetical protein n=1 Tax=Chitinophaga sedimenti TaxID=2033606 RepID=UPI002006D041|nr:hypothetical protein [Chitinophaga sedimenti]MCK7559345.1 hypothetical protein [Chitinophaga sedimenti]